jgi:hypothetical protein
LSFNHPKPIKGLGALSQCYIDLEMLVVKGLEALQKARKRDLV